MQEIIDDILRFSFEFSWLKLFGSLWVFVASFVVVFRIQRYAETSNKADTKATAESKKIQQSAESKEKTTESSTPTTSKSQKFEAVFLAWVGAFALILFIFQAQLLFRSIPPFEIIMDFLNTIMFELGFEQDILKVIAFVLKVGNVYMHIMFLIMLAVVVLMVYFFIRVVLGRQPKIQAGFFEHQDLAKNKIFWLYVVFGVMLFLLFCASFNLFEIVFCALRPEILEPISWAEENPSAYSMLHPYGSIVFDKWNQKHFNSLNYLVYALISITLSMSLALIVLVSFIVKSIKLSRHSIDSLAKTLQATEIKTPKKLYEQRLLNIIEEMALASTMPMPRVFVMKDEDGINAACSGERFGKADERIAIFVTKGAITKLNREELQGVIGHEFSHAFHHDVALNLRLFSIVFAFSCVGLVGNIILRSIGNSSSSRNSKDSGGKGVAAVAAIAFIFIVVGYLGSLFSAIIQAAIARQKEFLADASSAQYTRNPSCLVSALEKIASLQNEQTTKESISTLNNQTAKPCAHMFFLRAFKGVFATHPPLHKRIESLKKM